MALCLALALSLSCPATGRAQALRNFGNDPFLHASDAVADCPEPAGPRISEDAWRRESHHRVEEGNHCWTEGRCRLSNSYQYDNEIAASLGRRLSTLTATHPGWRQSSLWITVRGRWLVVQGCLGPGFPKASFLAALREVADVERVVDQTTATPARGVPNTRQAPQGTPGQ